MSPSPRFHLVPLYIWGRYPTDGTARANPPEAANLRRFPLSVVFVVEMCYIHMLLR